ncbi:AraC family transcriptional regulator, partial [Tannerella forsythia]|uniref:AraC family transcriptional regulator n=1 Tax=Tannerella forsythia TaxID=28112 RepID=UPI00062AF11C
GQCRLNIDFEEYTFGKGSLAIIRPGQVHRIIDAFNLSAKFLVVDSVLVDKEEKRTLERYGCSKIQLSDISELKLLLSLLDRKLSCMENPSAKAIVQRLTTVIVGLVVENVANAIKVQSELQGTVSRHKEIVWEFRDLLENNIRINRSPSFYAGRLNITVAYLNEAVNAVLGTSVSRHIQDEIILQAKRKLVYTTASVKEIAHSLGFDDYSYFTRLFAKVVGVSPTLFRRTYHE